MTTFAKIEIKLNKELNSFLKKKALRLGNSREAKITYAEFLRDKMLIIEAIRSGIPYSLFEIIQHYSAFTDQDWAYFLDLSEKSLQRYKSNPQFQFKPIHSEKIIEIAEVTFVGLDCFGSIDKFRLWLNTPCFALGKNKPVDLLKDSYGKDMVLGELTRINHGILV
jgi:putative toxin-antitoxin system antitoxin component (TIGR02293 family)